MERRWYVIYTKSRQEKYVARWLSEKNISYYLPLQKIVRQWKDRRKWVEVPLIYSYIFVRVKDDREYMEILQTDGVVSFITFEGKPATVPEQQIKAIKLLLAGEAELEVTTDIFEKGDEIEVKAGPLKGLKGELINVKNKHKVMIRIEHIGQAVLVDINMKYLMKKNRH